MNARGTGVWQLRQMSKAAGRWPTVPWAIRRSGIAALVALCLVAAVDDPLPSLLPRVPIPVVIAGVEYTGSAPDLGAFEGGAVFALRIGV